MFASTEYGVPPFGSLTQCPCEVLCNLTTCYSSESAWFQRFKVTCDEALTNFDFKSNLRRYIVVAIDGVVPLGAAPAGECRSGGRAGGQAPER